MKNKLTKITSGFVFAVFTATICAPGATAAPVNESQAIGSSFISQKAVDQTANPVSLANKTLSDLSVIGFSAKIVLNESSGPQIIDSSDSAQNLSTVLKSHGLDVSDFRSSGDTALDENYKLKNNESLSLFKSEASGTSSVVILPAPEEKKESNDLYKGEEKIEQEGKDGTALRTVITTKNLAADTSVNTSAKKSKIDPSSSEEKLTILLAPQAKVTLVGTKERTAAAAVNQAPTQASFPTSGNSSSFATEAVSGNGTAPSVVKPAPSNSSNSSVANLAIAQIGKPYVWGAAGANAFDCSGLVQWIFANNLGYNIPRTAYAQGMAGTPVSPADIQPGDIVYTSYHIGIYVGNGKMVHASSPETGVIMDDVKYYLSSGYKISRL